MRTHPFDMATIRAAPEPGADCVISLSWSDGIYTLRTVPDPEHEPDRAMQNVTREQAVGDATHSIRTPEPLLASNVCTIPDKDRLCADNAVSPFAWGCKFRDWCASRIGFSGPGFRKRTGLDTKGLHPQKCTRSLFQTTTARSPTKTFTRCWPNVMLPPVRPTISPSTGRGGSRILKPWRRTLLLRLPRNSGLKNCSQP